MDSKKAEALINKYWKGSAHLKEEKELKAYFHKKHGGPNAERSYFDYLAIKSTENPLDDQFDEEILSIIKEEKPVETRKKNTLKYWSIAASLAFVISIGIIFRNDFIKVEPQVQVVEVDTYDDPEKAFEETKRALQLISSKLNQGDAYASQFSKFEQSQENLKQN